MRQRSDGGAPDAEAAPAPPPLPVDVVDSHCHLDLVGGDVQEVLDAGAAVGVPRVVTIGIDVASSRFAAELAAAYPAVAAAVAIHPNEAGTADAAALAEIERLAALPQVRAVGETGLDFYRDSADVADQQRSFRAHIAIAKSSGKALVIHDREAHDAVLAALEEEGAPEQTVFHCFSGDAELARRCADLGYVMSFAGNVTFKNAQPLREAVAAAPLELLLVETDAPFLTPMPHRGKANAPYLIPLTVRVMAQCKGVSEEELATAIAATSERVFGPW
ncbi:MAG TPA: TatD family hydrolase [Mycobacteriales bacterium]|nr:TatD family hydrolase [Mycobacteriales bacterium]